MMKRLLLVIAIALPIFACSKDDGGGTGCGYHNGKPLHKGADGGCYYINTNGNKTYVDRSECNC